MIGKRIIKPIDASDYRETSIWCDGNNATIEDKGDWYEVVAIPAPTPEEQQAILIERFRSAIQSWMDGEAMKLGYDSILSVCSYINTGNPKFDAEGEGFRQWRSAVWARGYELIDEVIAGQREVPDDPADVIALLPELTIVYPDVTQLDWNDPVEEVRDGEISE